MPFAVIFFSSDAELPGRGFMSYSRQPPLSEYYGILGQKRCFVRTAGKSRFFFRRTGGQGGRRCLKKSKGSMFAREKKARYRRLFCRRRVCFLDNIAFKTAGKKKAACGSYSKYPAGRNACSAAFAGIARGARVFAGVVFPLRVGGDFSG